MNPQHKLYIAFAALVLFFGAVFVKLIFLQVVEYDEWLGKADQQHIREYVQSKQRGKIYDRNGVVLAYDVEAISVALDNYHMTKPEILEELLKKHFKISAEQAQSLIYKEGYFTWIQRKVDPEVAKALREEASDLGIWGLVYISEWKRVYPQGALASNIIGFAGVDNRGLEGIELQFDELLRGTEEIREVIRGGGGSQLASRVIQQGVPGNDIYLTIDAHIQHIAEREIQTAASYRRADGAYAVVLDPKSGDILALASDKTYDLNDYQISTAAQRNNWIVALTVEPGSTFKPFAVLAALEAGTTTPDEYCDASPSRRFMGHTFRNAQNYDYNPATTSKIVEASANTGILCIVQDMINTLGEDEAKQYFHEFLTRFGLGEPLGIDLPGEVGGILRTPDNWWGQDMGSISIGQSVSVTGVQLAAAYGAFANGGWLRTPQIIGRFESPTGIELESPRNPNPRKIIADEHVSNLRMMLRRVVEGEKGTGRNAKIEGFEVAGKSGTGEKALPGRAYGNDTYYSLFTGFFPASDPQYVTIVVFDEVKTRAIPVGWYYGGVVAAPVFRRISEAIIEYDQLVPVALP
jgi:cell division protein FtsI/penicillin-binding protein 2